MRVRRGHTVTVDVDVDLGDLLANMSEDEIIEVMERHGFRCTPIALDPTGPWIVELAELDGLNKADSAAAKAFFARDTDRIRQIVSDITGRVL